MGPSVVAGAVKYFRLTFDPATPKAQIVLERDSAGTPVALGATTACRPYQGPGPLEAQIRDAGDIPDVAFPLAQGPLLRADLAAAVQELASGDIQWLDVQIPGVRDEFLLANVLREIDCVDEQWAWNGSSARFAGHGSGTARTLKVREDLVRAAHMFRVMNWRVALLVSDDLRFMLEARRATGIRFEEV